MSIDNPSKKEIWTDNYGDPVAVEIFEHLGSVMVLCGFWTIQEAKDQYPDATINLDEVYNWEDYDDN